MNKIKINKDTKTTRKQQHVPKTYKYKLQAII